MALPLLWIGAAVLSAVSIGELNQQRKRAENERLRSKDIIRRGKSDTHYSGIEKYPAESFSVATFATIQPGCLVCCGLGGVLEHTGILIDEHTIVELHGSGLVKAISPKRFLNERSGNQIYVACDSNGLAISAQAIADRASNQVFTFQKYDVIANNCHRFAWQCISGENESVTTFHQLNKLFSKKFDRKIYWDKWDTIL